MLFALWLILGGLWAFRRASEGSVGRAETIVPDTTWNMVLAGCSRLGHYDVTVLIGQEAIRQVYRAIDGQRSGAQERQDE